MCESYYNVGLEVLLKERIVDLDHKYEDLKGKLKIVEDERSSAKVAVNAILSYKSNVEPPLACEEKNPCIAISDGRIEVVNKKTIIRTGARLEKKKGMKARNFILDLLGDAAMREEELYKVLKETSGIKSRYALSYHLQFLAEVGQVANDGNMWYIVKV